MRIRFLAGVFFATTSLILSGCSGVPEATPKEPPLPTLSESDAAAIIGVFGLVKQTPADDASGAVTGYTDLLQKTLKKPESQAVDLGVQGNRLVEFAVQQTGMPWPACFAVRNDTLPGEHRTWVILFDPPLFGRDNEDLGSLLLVRDSITTCEEAFNAIDNYATEKDRNGATLKTERYIRAAFLALPAEQVTPYGDKLLKWAITGEDEPQAAPADPVTTSPSTDN